MQATTKESAWDWVLLYYVGTVILKMSPLNFWFCTPRKLHKLSKIHSDINNPSTEAGADKKYIDQIL